MPSPALPSRPCPGPRSALPSALWARLRPLLLAALLAAPAAPAAAQGLPARFTVVGVAADDVLNLRAAPSPSARVIATLRPGDTGVEIVQVSPDGSWGLVPFGEGAAWASLRFLAPETPAPTPLPRPLLCRGTEPFWALTLDDQGDRWETPEGGTVPLRPQGEAAGFAGGVATFDRAGATLDLTVVRRGCSDGMSDRPYGLTAFVWDRDGEFLEGCCTLTAR